MAQAGGWFTGKTTARILLRLENRLTVRISGPFVNKNLEEIALVT